MKRGERTGLMGHMALEFKTKRASLFRLAPQKTWSGGTPPISPDYSIDPFASLASGHFAVLHVLFIVLFSQTVTLIWRF